MQYKTQMKTLPVKRYIRDLRGIVVQLKDLSLSKPTAMTLSTELFAPYVLIKEALFPQT